MIGELFMMYQSGSKRTCLILVILRQLPGLAATCRDAASGSFPHYSDADGL